MLAIFKQLTFIAFLILSFGQFTYANDVSIAIIDTGIDPSASLFKNRLYLNKQLVSGDKYGVDFSKDNFSKVKPFDDHGHGTHIAGIIAKNAPHAKLHILKYYNPDASGQENLDSTIQALEYAIKMNVDIINYSSGGPEPSLKEKRLFDLAEKKGILIVSAAGNNGENIDSYGKEFFPASYHHHNIITVGSHDKNFRPLNSSNFGRRSVDLFAPGKKILSTLPNDREGYLTGTSQATAFVSAIAANIAHRYKKTDPAFLKKKILKSVVRMKHLQEYCVTSGILNLKNSPNSASRELASNQ